MSGEPCCDYAPNFIKIGQYAVKILYVSIFKVAALRHLEFCTKWILNILRPLGTHFLLTYQIWCNEIDPRPRYSLKTKFNWRPLTAHFYFRFRF